MNPSGVGKPWLTSKTHATFGVLMVLGALAVVVGFLLPFVGGAHRITGVDLPVLAYRGVEKYLGMIAQAQRLPTDLPVPDEIVQALVSAQEALLALVVIAFCVGIVVAGCVYALIKYAVARRSALYGVYLPFVILLVAVGYVLYRLYAVGAALNDGGLGSMALRMLLDRLEDLLQGFPLGAGVPVYLGGLFLAMISTSVMRGIERRALKGVPRAATVPASAAGGVTVAALVVVGAAAGAFLALGPSSAAARTPPAEDPYPKRSPCTDPTFCPPHPTAVLGYLDRICDGTFGPADLEDVKADIAAGRLSKKDLPWLFNMYGAGWGYVFQKLPHLNIFYYGSDSDQWLPESCLRFRNSVPSMGALRPIEVRMMAGLKALR